MTPTPEHARLNDAAITLRAVALWLKQWKPFIDGSGYDELRAILSNQPLAGKIVKEQLEPWEKGLKEHEASHPCPNQHDDFLGGWNRAIAHERGNTHIMADAMTIADIRQSIVMFPEAFDVLTRQEMRDAKGNIRSLIAQQTASLAHLRTILEMEHHPRA